MKKIVFSLLTMASSFVSMAQRAEIDSVKEGGFIGIKPFMEGEFYCTFYIGGATTAPAMTKYNLKVYNKDLMEGATMMVEMPETAVLTAQAFTGEFAIMEFADDETRTILILNQQNEVVNRKVEENINTGADRNDRSYIVPVSPRDIVLIRPKQGGYEMVRMDVDLNTTWTKVFKPESGRWGVSKIAFMGDMICLLREERKGDDLDNYAYQLQAISASDGAEIFNRNLNGVPGFLDINREMKISVGGLSYKNAKLDKNAEAIFFVMLNANGSISTESITPLQMMETVAANDFTKAIANGNLGIQAEGLFSKGFEEGYTLIGETYKLTQASAATQEGKEGKKGKNKNKNAVADPSAKADIAIMDLVSLDFNRDGIFTGFSKVDKASKQVAIKGEMATLPAPVMAERLQDAGFFGYTGSVEMHNKQYIGFIDEKDGKRKLHFFEAGTTLVNNADGINIDDVARTGKYEFAAMGNAISDYGMLPGREGSILLYRVNEPKLILWKEQTLMNDMQAPPGQPMQPGQPNSK